MTEQARISIVTLSVNNENDKIYVLCLAGKDNEFILTELYNKSFNKNIGIEIANLTQNISKETGKFKNDIIDLVRATINYGYVLDSINFDKNSYIAIGLKFESLKKIVKFESSFLVGYNEEQIVFLFFTPLAQIEEKIIKKSIEAYFSSLKLGPIDILKFLGIKTMLFLLISPIIIHHLVPPGLLVESLKSIGINLPSLNQKR